MIVQKMPNWLTGIIIFMCMQLSTCMQIFCTITQKNNTATPFIIERNRIELQYKKWNKLFQQKKYNRYTIITLFSCFFGGLLYYHLLVQKDDNSQLKNKIDTNENYSIDIATIQNFLHQRQSRRTWKNVFKLEIIHCFDQAIVYAFSGFFIMLFARASSWLYQNIEDKIGLKEENILYKAINSFTLDAVRLHNASKSLCASNVFQYKDDIFATIFFQELVNGVFFDQKIFIETFEQCAGLIMYYIEKNSLDIKQRFDQCIDLANDIFIRQQNIFENIKNFENSSKATLAMMMIKEIQEEWIRFMEIVGRLVYGESFTLQTKNFIETQ